MNTKVNQKIIQQETESLCNLAELLASKFSLNYLEAHCVTLFLLEGLRIDLEGKKKEDRRIGRVVKEVRRRIYEGLHKV